MKTSATLLGASSFLCGFSMVTACWNLSLHQWIGAAFMGVCVLVNLGAAYVAGRKL